MLPERWERIKELFHAALDRPAEQRQAFLLAECGTDEEVRREVEELLAHDQGVAEGEAEAADEDPGHTQAADPAVQPVPDAIGPYRIVRLLGEGGMGVVYLAERTEPIHQAVALKVLKAGMDSRRIIARFEAERNLLAMMEHPNIARIFDAGLTDDHRPFFAMEYAPGEPITGFCDRRSLSIQQRLELFTQVCEAIQHAHHKGVIHRDIKPSNLLVVEQDGQPQVKVIDFGVAKALAHEPLEQTLLTEEGILVGTPEYMSPEQAAGAPDAVDIRSDIYSLGVVLYELLAGVPPFEPEELRRAGLEAILRTIREADPPHPSTRLRYLGDRATDAARHRGTIVPTLVSTLRCELEWIPLKALRKDPGQRYHSVAELAGDIANYLAGRPLLAGPESIWYRTRKLLRPYRAHLAITAGFAVILAIIVPVLVHVVRANRQLAESASLPEYLTCIKAAQKALNNGAWDTLRQQLDRAPARHRNWEWHYLNSQHEDQKALSGPGNAASDRDALVLRQPMLLRGNSGWTRSAVFSPDGARILTASGDQTARIWDAVTGRKLVVLWGHTSLVERATFSPDNRLVLTGSADQTARLWDAATGRPIRLLAGHQGEVTAVAFSPDSRRIVTGSKDNTARLWDAGSGKEIMVLRGHERDVRSVSFSPDGKRVLTGSYDRTTRIWDAATGRQLNVIRGHRDEVVSAAFSPDGTRIITGSQDATVRLWEAVTGGELNTLHGHGGRVYSVAFSPDGSRIVSASADGTIRLWHARTGETVLVLPAPKHPFWVAFSPDGRRIVAGLATWDNACVWDRLPMRVRHTERLAALAARSQAESVVSESYARLRDWSRVAAEIENRRGLSNEVRTQALHGVLLKCAAESSESEQALSTIYELESLAQSVQGVQEGVTLALSISPRPADLAMAAPRQLLWYGEFLIVGGQAEKAATAIKSAAGQYGAEDYYSKSLGWALLSCGREMEAMAALRQSLRACSDWSNGPPANADPDHWCSAYYLGLVTEEEFLKRWCEDAVAKRTLGPVIWFAVGQLREVRGQREEAILAYRNSVSLGSSEGAHWSANFAAYRLGVLTGRIVPPAGTTGPAESAPEALGGMPSPR
ncbi:MAG: serine/threonine protein kinase [Phycisphaerae bacterium]|nr:serine/threonine protein kinase [Phycisphaerae bacterium]